MVATPSWAAAQKQQVWDMEVDHSAITSGPQTNNTNQPTIAFTHEAFYPQSVWTKFAFSGVVLGNGDVIRLTSQANGDQQWISNNDPQYGGAQILSAMFNRGRVTIDLIVAPGNTSQFTITTAWAAHPLADNTRSICGTTDDRVASADPCVVRVVDSNGLYASGFMISDNWMISANHVMTGAPWTIERNVPASDPNGRINAAAAADQFPVANLNASQTSAAVAKGDDWAVVNVPNNAGGAPGAGCSPMFDCAYNKNQVPPATLTAKGYGLDDGAASGTQQSDSGDSVPGGDNATHFRHRADTRGNSSGGPVSDSSGRIVGIHTNGGCNGDDPETGSNSGTLICNLGLLAAIKDLCGVEICPGKIIPTVGEWGLIMMALLMGVAATLVFARKPALAGVSETYTAPPRRVHPELLLRTLAYGGAITLLGLAIVQSLGALTPTDLAGTLVTLPIAAYLVHLWIALSRERD